MYRWMVARGRRNSMYFQFTYNRLSPPKSLFQLVGSMNAKISRKRGVIRDIINDSIQSTNVSSEANLCREILY